MDAHLIMEVLYFMRKKQEKITVPQTGTEMSETKAVMDEELAVAGDAEAVSQTGSEKEPEITGGSAEVSSVGAVSQTGSEKELEIAGESAEVSSAEAVPQTDSEKEAEPAADCEAGVFSEPVSQMGPEDEQCLDKAVRETALLEAISHTGSEKEAEIIGGSAEVTGIEAIPHTGSEKEPEITGGSAEAGSAEEVPQTGSENEADSEEIQEEGVSSEAVPQTGFENGSYGQQSVPGPISGTGQRGQTQSRSDRIAGINRNTRFGITAPILSIDGHLAVETDADRSRNDLLDLLESQKTGRILTGTIQGVERQSDMPGHSLAVLYHGDYKIIIPADEAVEPPQEDSGRRIPGDALHYMVTKRLGAEVDYIVKGIDQETGLAAASRLEAMRARRKEYYFGTDREGNYILHSGVCAEARVVSVIRAGIFVDLFGLELYVPLRELSYQRWMDAAAHFQPGQRILVKVLEVDRRDRNNVKASVSVKQAQENPYEKALRRYSVGNRYVGTVSMVDTTGVFVALDGGIDCLCSYPKRGRPPRGSRVTVRILGIDHVSNRIWGAITHIAVPR